MKSSQSKETDAGRELAGPHGRTWEKGGVELADESIRLRRSLALRLQQAARNERLAARTALASMTHIRDEVLIDQLVALGIRVDTLLALSLVPLAEIAWADGSVDEAEKHAILQAARAAGLEPESLGERLLESCLVQRPPAFLRHLWSRYVGSVREGLSEEERRKLRQEVLDRARRVAESAGPGLEPGSNVSAEERALLSLLNEAL